MLTADERLILLRVKVERAKHHLQNLAADILATERMNVVLADVQPKRGQNTPDGGNEYLGFTCGYPGKHEMLHDVPRFSAEVLSGVGDIAHNLRTALDHLMCQLLLVAGSAIKTSDYFPIAESPTKYEARRAGIVDRVRPEVIKALDRLKPYKGGNDFLWRIHELNRIDKHRSLFTLNHDFIFYADWLDGDFLFHKNAPDYAGLLDKEVEEKMQFEIEKTLSQPQVAGRDAILPSLHQIIDAVENVILGFKPFLE